MTPDERRRVIARYAAGYEEVTKALDGFPAELLGEKPIRGKWSAREIVHHLADSETTSALRLRKLIIEDHPLILGYDQERWAERLHYNERTDIAPSLEAFRAARASTVQLLERMTEEEWTKPGFHNESGPYTAERWLTIYAAHAHDHASQIRRLREALLAGRRA